MVLVAYHEICFIFWIVLSALPSHTYPQQEAACLRQAAFGASETQFLVSSVAGLEGFNLDLHLLEDFRLRQA
jgi:hypothetical protein